MCSSSAVQTLDGRRHTTLASALAAVGLTSVIAQVVLIREIGAVFYGNELSMGVVLAVWLLSVAAGTWLLGRPADRIKDGPMALALGLVVSGLLPILQLLLVRTARWWLNLTPGALAGLDTIALAIVVVLSLLCVCLGFLFRLGARLFDESGRPLAAAYVWEAVGAALGGVLFTFVLVRWGNPFGVAFLVAAANWTAAFGLCTGYSRRRAICALCLLGAIACLLAAALPAAEWNFSTLRWQYPSLLFAADSIYGRVAVTGQDSQRVFYENGLVMFDTQSLAAEEVIHPALLAHSNPGRVLLMGGGVGGGLREALKHPLATLDYVELDPLIVETASRFLPIEDALRLYDPRVTVINEDGRRYLSAVVQAQYDVIIIDLPEPSTGQLNRFYTSEFYRLARARLAPNGILAFGLPSAENYLNRELRRRNGSIYATLREVFAHIVVLPGDRNIFLASDVPIAADPEVWAARLEERQVQAKQVTAPYLRFLFTTERYAKLRETLQAEIGRINRDFKPVCYYYDMILWLSRFYGELGPLFYLPTGAHLWPLAVLSLLLGLILRWRRRWRTPGAALLAGLAGMSAEIVLLLAFQALYGNVYWLVGLVVAAFMVGTAAGAAWLERRQGAGRTTLIALLGGLGVYMWLIPPITQVTAPIAPLTVPALALVGGGLVGAVFPVAVNLVAGQAGPRAGLIYAVDLVGGCLGALCAAVLWIPLLGIPVTCALVGLWAIIGAVAQ